MGVCVWVCVCMGKGFLLVSKFNTQCIYNTYMYYMNNIEYKINVLCTSVQKFNMKYYESLSC